MGSLAGLNNQLNEERFSCLAVIECARGQRNKFAYDEQLEAFYLKRLLPAGLSFPLDFGFVPATRAGDGDPLDIMVVHDTPLPTGAVLEVRIAGVIEAEQMVNGQSGRNDRLIGVAAASVQFQDITGVEDLGRAFIDSLEAFWRNYERLRGVDFRILNIKGREAAINNIKSANCWN